MGNPRIEIKSEGAVVRTYIDGHEIHGIRGMKFECDAIDRRPRLILDINAFDFSLDSNLINIIANNMGVEKIVFNDGTESTFEVEEKESA